MRDASSSAMRRTHRETGCSPAARSSSSRSDAFMATDRQVKPVDFCIGTTYDCAMGSFDQQVAVASKDFAELWKRAAPRLAKTHHVKFPGRMRPVEFMEPVVLEDVFSRLIGVLQALHDGYGRTQGEHAGLWLDQQLAGCPSLQKAVRDIPISCWKRGLSEAGWRRRLSQNAEQVLGVLLGKDARTLRRRRGDYLRLERADLRLTRCECGTAFYRRRSEPNAPNLCELCRERESVTALSITRSA